MVRRLFQALAVFFMILVLFRYVSWNFDALFLEIYWREISFGLISIVAAWMFKVTHTLRPVIAVFATLAFLVIAKLDQPSTANLVAVLDGMSARILTGIQLFSRG